MLIFHRPLSEVLAVPANQAGVAAADERAVDAYVQANKALPGPMPPIVLEDAGVCVNGFARIAAAVKLGQQEIAFVFESDVPAHVRVHGFKEQE